MRRVQRTPPVNKPNKPRSRIGSLLLGAILVAAVAVPSGANGATPGLNIGVTSAVSTQYASMVSALAPGWVRIFVGWYATEPARGQYNQSDLSLIDRTIANLPPGTKVDLDLVGTPSWSAPGGNAAVPNATDFANFAAFMATRYRGTVAALELWNEPDNTTFFTGSAAQYAGLLKAAYPAIKAANPNMFVISAGLVGNDYDYLEQIYQAGAGADFDAVGIHTDTACNTTSPYSYLRDPDGRINRFSFLGYREVHATMANNGDGAKPIYMTEFGWNTSTITCPYGAFAGQKPGGVSPSDQATFMQQAFHCLAQDSYVAGAFWFEFQDAGPTDTTEQRFGLVNTGFAQKPSYAAFSAYTHQGDQLTDACGNFTGPSISIASPKPNVSFSGPLTIKVSASSGAGVARISLLHDNQLIRNFTSRSWPHTLSGLINWQGAKRLSKGKHVITILAKDPQGNVTTISVTVIRK